ncbi:transposase [Streptomyces sp. NPDC001714]|uniref:transposase n=1 Tax=Streptomyces sp. NPDC001714 TaxID=3364603 RepID=UPI0036A78DBB
MPTGRGVRAAHRPAAARGPRSRGPRRGAVGLRAGLSDHQDVRPRTPRGPGHGRRDADHRRKRHLGCDTLGLLLTVLVTAAGVSDTAVGVTLLSRIAAAHPHITKAWVDAGYRTTAVDHGARLGIDVHPVQRPPGARGFTIIPRRWTIERSIGRLMHHRRLARDYERHPHRPEAMIHLAVIDFMARRHTGEATLNRRGT